ncbi:MAG TPA: ABC transporter ATP-binding protein [Gemmatimonadales bacterium]|nr:ABC transporter ATP-binding protein [Gemmatimonadales bacterium]
MYKPSADAGVDFEGVWKKFQTGERHDSLRDLIPAVAKRMMGKAPRRHELAANQFWALQDVSFQVRPGDVLGIIGRNGAGKSTILKTLTKIIPPTLGRAEVRGRVGALIEIAAGFHQDLTGRENVFLQGAIMGMPKALIKERFDEIIEFSGVGAFIDTPVKRYSSGMNARLGFAIAAHLSPDVLIIDEVLSVGDFDFQQRAFGRMLSLARSGIPVVVVSHQLDRVAELCTSAILLERGRIRMAGNTSECIQEYLSVERQVTDADSPVFLDEIRVDEPEVASGERVQVTLTGRVNPDRAVGDEIVALTLRNLQDGRDLSIVTTDTAGIALPREGRFEIAFSLQMNVQPGLYGLDSSIWKKEHRGDVAIGPGAHIQVTKSTGFYGTVQPNAEVALVNGARAHARIGLG